MSTGLRKHLTEQSRLIVPAKVELAAKSQQNNNRPNNQGRHPPQLSVERARVELKVAKSARFVGRHKVLMQHLHQKPVDVRVLARLVNKFGHILVWFVHLYANARAFLRAHQAGCCSKVVQDNRYEICKSCDWAYTHRSSTYCSGCNCPNWPASRLTHKVRLAKFACPRGQFGEASGWMKRSIGFLWRMSVPLSSASKRKKVTHTRKTKRRRRKR